MHRSEIVHLLATCVAYDQRTTGETDVEAWWQVLRRYDLETALEAVIDHYANHTDRIMPAHVVAYCRKAGNDRAARAELPAGNGTSDMTTVQRIRASMLEYEVRDQDGTLLHRGPAKLLADRVYAVPDVAKRLTEPPLCYTQKWNGYVPPLVSEHPLKGPVIVNDSPFRAALLAIIKDARAAAGHVEQEQAS